MRIGVLALQGGVAEHERVLADLGVDTVMVRRPAHLDGIDGIILPGGESTTQSKLLRSEGLADPLADALAAGLPAYGTCAGMILLAGTVLDTRDDAVRLGALDATVRRNAFGRQVDSFEADLDFTGIADPVHAVFIRAPQVTDVGDGVEVLARAPGGEIVAVRDGHVMATSFHPECQPGETRVHRLFLDTCVAVA